MLRDEGFERMLDTEYVEAEPILRRTLLERAPGFGVTEQTMRALEDLPDGRYTRREVELHVEARAARR